MAKLGRSICTESTSARRRAGHLPRRGISQHSGVDNSRWRTSNSDRLKVDSFAKTGTFFFIFSDRNFWPRTFTAESNGFEYGTRDNQSLRFTTRNKPFATIASYYKRFRFRQFARRIGKKKIYLRAAEKRFKTDGTATEFARAL